MNHQQMATHPPTHPPQEYAHWAAQWAYAHWDAQFGRILGILYRYSLVKVTGVPIVGDSDTSQGKSKDRK